MSGQVIIKFLLQGESPLFTASLIGHLEIVKTLIEVGSNINQTDKVCLSTVSFFFYPYSPYH